MGPIVRAHGPLCIGRVARVAREPRCQLEEAPVGDRVLVAVAVVEGVDLPAQAAATRGRVPALRLGVEDGLREREPVRFVARRVGEVLLGGGNHAEAPETLVVVALRGVVVSVGGGWVGGGENADADAETDADADARVTLTGSAACNPYPAPSGVAAPRSRPDYTPHRRYNTSSRRAPVSVSDDPNPNPETEKNKPQKQHPTPTNNTDPQTSQESHRSCSQDTSASSCARSAQQRIGPILFCFAFTSAFFRSSSLSREGAREKRTSVIDC